MVVMIEWQRRHSTWIWMRIWCEYIYRDDSFIFGSNLYLRVTLNFISRCCGRALCLFVIYAIGSWSKENDNICWCELRANKVPPTGTAAIWNDDVTFTFGKYGVRTCECVDSGKSVQPGHRYRLEDAGVCYQPVVDDDDVIFHLHCDANRCRCVFHFDLESHFPTAGVIIIANGTQYPCHAIASPFVNNFILRE